MPSSERRSRILVVEDEASIAELVATELRFEGHEVEVASDGLAGLEAARRFRPDLAILDLMLPGMDGLTLCRKLQESSEARILMLTARGDVPDRVRGLDAGASDYLAKPFDLEELLARVRALLRSRKGQEHPSLTLGDLTLDPVTREVVRHGREIQLTPKEFDLLHYLLQHPRQVLNRDQIMSQVWGHDYNGEENVIEVCIRSLRHKIEAEDEPKLIHTVRGVGYQIKDH